MPNTQVCKRCGIERPIDRFTNPLWKCKTCDSDHAREKRHEKRAKYLAENPKPIRTSKPCKVCKVDKPFSEYRFADKAKGTLSSYCKPCQSKLSCAHRATKGLVKSKCTRLRTTVAWFHDQLEKQNGNCAICENPETQIHDKKQSDRVRSLAIDHNHDTGKVRGLLCFRCNTALYQLEKNGRDWAHKAVEYLDKYDQETRDDEHAN
jgi:Recombination endonuclease VII